jgi:hypothetical protein
MSTVIVTLDGADITSMVLFESAHFESQVNGIAGEARFRVRDLTGTYSVSLGSEVTLSVDGSVVWRGFLMQWIRIYVFPALNVTEFGLARFFDAVCSDINLLFTKRFVYNQSTPTNVLAPLLAEHTADTTALTELFDDWIDLTGDGIDTTSLVENVGDTTWTQEGRAWSGSDSWGQAVSSIANMPAAIYYIDPDKNFVYTDVDTPNAPFGLSDQPNGSTTKGYSSMDILKDGTALANDVFAWGAGYGSNQPVFVRNQDATSQSEHGVWQSATTVFGVFKQATIERIAESIIDGSPQSKRGAKDDRVAVTCVTYEPGLRVAEKVDFTSNVFGFNDVIPIRKMAIDFEAPTKPKYSLTLSHEIDTPFSFFDPFLFDLNIHIKEPKICPPGFLPGPQGKCIPIIIPGPQGCSPSVCGITDSFTREVEDGWGQSDYGATWTSTYLNGGAADVGAGTPGTARLYLFNTVPNDVYAEMQLDYGSSNGTVNTLLSGVQATFTGTLGSAGVSYTIHPNNDSAYAVYFTYSSVSGQFFAATDGAGTNGFSTPGVDGLQPCNIRIEQSPTVFRIKVWQVGDPEPSSWSFTSTHLVTVNTGGRFSFQGNSLSLGLYTVTIDSIDIEGANRCTAPQFDDFERTVSAAAGTATPSGLVWNTHASPGGSDYGVNGSDLFVGMSGGTFEIRTDPGVEPWLSSDLMTFETRFYFYQDFGVFANFGRFQMELQYDNGGGDNGSVGWVFQINSVSGGFNLYSSPSGGTTPYALPSAWSTFDYSDDDELIWFRVKWQTRLSTGDISAKVWLETDGEPAAWSVVAPPGFIHPLDPASTRFFTSIGSSFASRAEYVDFIEWDYVGRPCYVGGPDSTVLPPANVWACESIIASGSPYFPLSRSFILNSPQVWVSGILQSRASYIQDAVAGTIVLDFTPDPGSTVRICYWSLP